MGLIPSLVNLQKILFTYPSVTLSGEKALKLSFVIQGIQSVDCEEAFLDLVPSDPQSCFNLLNGSTLNTPSEPFFLSMLQHMLCIRDDMIAR